MRPLVKRTPGGFRYAVPATPRYPAPGSGAQPTSDTTSRPEPTPPQPGRHMGRARLTDDEVRAIRAEYATGKWNRADLAYIYRVSLAAIHAVLNGRSYTHVTGGRDWTRAAEDTTETTPREEG